MFCARHAILGTGVTADPSTVHQNGYPSSFEPAGTTGGDSSREPGGGGGSSGRGGSEEDDSSFMLVLGDHLYRRGAGTTHACASQLIHAFLEHGEVGKPAIGIKVRKGGRNPAAGKKRVGDPRDPHFLEAVRMRRACPVMRVCM